jgi:hypothetical protein
MNKNLVINASPVILLGKAGSPYKTMQVWKYRHVLLCKHLIFHHVLPEAIICNLLKLLTRIVL